MLQFEVFTPFLFSPSGEKNTGGKTPRKKREIKLIIIKLKYRLLENSQHIAA
jgi:hypothetical protein